MRKNVLVLGLGVSGLSACRFLLKNGHTIFATDDKLEAARTKPEVAPFLQNPAVQLLTKEEALEKLDSEQVSFVVPSPGIFPTHALLVAAKEKGLEIIGDVELACRELVTYIPTVLMVGITGTNGKTTVTMLTACMLQEAHFMAKTVGNIGLPILDELEEVKKENCCLVAELSSFQLETMQQQVFQAGVILNVTPDHLDYHGSMHNYEEAKMRLVHCIKPNGAFFVHEKIELPAGFEVLRYGFQATSDVYSDGEHVYRFDKREIELPASLKDNFSHDTENFLAAYLLARECKVPPEACIKAFVSFKKPPHRIQFVKEVQKVKYYDDSKGTNIDAVIRAVESLPTKIILIAGGVHKGEAYSCWLDHFQDKVRAIVAIGQAAQLLEQDLGFKIPVKICSSLEEAVLSAKGIAKEGESVLLSPGCASFDMFKNYKERGEKFQAFVETL